jgi:phosphoribosylanthranilate isomerase
VAEAVRAGRPDGVDVASGVESAPGVKDPDKVARFVRAAKLALDALPTGGQPR